MLYQFLIKHFLLKAIRNHFIFLRKMNNTFYNEIVKTLYKKYYRYF